VANSWEDDKTAILERLVEIYGAIKNSINRYEAGREILLDLDFFIDRLIGGDETISSMIDIDKEFVNGYFAAMSELVGEEK
jgi:hypothetical protein